MTALLTDDATREAARLHVSDYCDVDQGAMEPETKAWNERLGGYSKSVEGYCASKIAALRKELENG